MSLFVRVQTRWKLLMSGPSNGLFVSVTGGENTATGCRQRMLNAPIGAPGPSRSRKTPYAGPLLPDKFAPQAPLSSARTVYQNVFPASPGRLGAPRPVST